MAKPVYKRVLLKISGEALAGGKGTGLDFEMIGSVCDVIKECLDMGVQVGVVIGGGNFWRGAKNSGGKMERTRADHMGMLATVMNCLAVADVCEQKGILIYAARPGDTVFDIAKHLRVPQSLVKESCPSKDSFEGSEKIVVFNA